MKFAIAVLATCAAVAAAELSAKQQARLTELLDADAEIAALVQARDRRAAHSGKNPSVFDLSNEVANLQTQFVAAVGEPSALTGTIEATISSAIAENRALIKMVEDQQSFKDELLTDIKTADAGNKAARKKLADSLNAAIDSASSALNDEKSTADKNLEKLNNKVSDFEAEVSKTLSSLDTLQDQVGKTVDDKLKPIASSFGVLDRLALTYLNDPKIPVFRWNWWHTHQHGSTSWFDGNNPRGFGGVNPSTWSDGNGCANDMNSDFKYMKRLFIQHGTADKWGASICQDCFFMHSSTTGRMCGSLWRIKNTKNTGVSWNPEFMYTSFGGWGEYASASLNGANNFRRHCNHSWCRTNINMNIPANSAGDRISTVIFISSGSGDYYIHEGNYERANAHHFNNNALDLPGGLEYVDDLDTVTGNWKQ